MSQKIEKRIIDLEREANTEGDYRVIVDWDPDPKIPKDKDVKMIEWGDNDEIIETS